jgi:cellulose synthase/poly-beta-1,6-N-acetylglucosamine synthase-like glycosyltransferase
MTLAVFFFRQGIIENPALTDFVMYLYFISLLILFAFGAHGFVMVYHYMKQRGLERIQPPLIQVPVVTVQLPLFNELYVAKRLIDAVCALEYPKDKLEVQVLDDSTDETVQLVVPGTWL